MKTKFAIVDGERREAQPGLTAKCPICESPVVAKCGKIRVWHWAHRGKLICDPWWENKTEWHRAWQGLFPIDWQEVPHQAENGDKHFADVKTDQGWVLEFQHSNISPEERQSRNAFYQKIVWVVNGKRRIRDVSKFSEELKRGVQVNEKLPLLKLSGYLDECALLRDWVGSEVPVFFDFGEEQIIWYLVPKSSLSLAYVLRVSRASFIELFKGGVQKAPELEFWFKELIKIVSSYTANLQRQSQSQTLPPMPYGRLRGKPYYHHYPNYGKRYRRRF